MLNPLSLFFNTLTTGSQPDRAHLKGSDNNSIKHPEMFGLAEADESYLISSLILIPSTLY